MTKHHNSRPENDTLAQARRYRFEESSSLRDDDAGIAGWSFAGPDARMRRFAELWHPNRPGARWLDAGCGAGTCTRFVGTPLLRWMLRVLPVFGPLIIHSLIIRHAKPMPTSVAAEAPA